MALHPSNYEVCGAVMLGLPRRARFSKVATARRAAAFTPDEACRAVGRRRPDRRRQPAYADIVFVGQSRATPQLKRDVLTVVAGYAQASHGCGTITTVESAPLGDKYEP